MTEMTPTPDTNDDKKIETVLNKEQLSVHSNEYVASVNDSTTDEDENEENNNNLTYASNPAGYRLLPQEITNAQFNDSNLCDDADEEFLRFATNRIFSENNSDEHVESSSSINLPQKTSTNNDDELIWSKKLECEDITVDDEKELYIKSLMSKIVIPEKSIPEWAKQCPENTWHQKLQEKIACRQTSFFSEQNENK